MCISEISNQKTQKTHLNMCITAIIVDFTLEILLFYDLRVQQRSALGRAGESLSRNGGISIARIY